MEASEFEDKYHVLRMYSRRMEILTRMMHEMQKTGRRDQGSADEMWEALVRERDEIMSRLHISKTKTGKAKAVGSSEEVQSDSD